MVPPTLRVSSTTVITGARERLATLLGEVAAPGAFSAQRTAPVDGLNLEVRGLGCLRLPVSDAQAKRLCRLGRPARYGRGEETLIDPRVRDTWEIPKSRVRIDKRRWNKTLLPMLDRLRGDLGLPEGCRLKAELHSMLVYAPGQFFVPHQDSEKADAMVGTLVVTLPASFTGGALVVEHRGEQKTYRSSKKSLSFVAFYADCRHQIRPVTSGYRIVLTYNLLLRGETAIPALTEAATETVEALARCLDEHFTTPLPSSQRFAGDRGADPPNRLVYLLDHEYTARGLSWSRLKGSDARRAAALGAAAARADCDIVLALADIHETWSCFEPEWDGPWHGRSRYRRWDNWDDEDGSGPEAPTDPDGYELDELVDWSVTLNCWIDPSGKQAEPIVTSVHDAEVCATTPSVELQPYSSEYEGYMGNYGNTMDRWYHRGALVLWPRRRSFAVRAEASPAWALDALSERVRAGDVTGAQESAATLAPFWNAVAGTEQHRRVLAKALRVAEALDQPALASMLLQPFRPELLARSHAPALVALVAGYGDQWAGHLFGVWFGRGRHGSLPGLQDRLAWVAALGRLCEALHAAGDTGASTARLLVQESRGWLRDEVQRRCDLMPPSQRDKALGELARPILGVLESIAVIAAADLRDEVVGFLCAEDDRLLGCLMQVLRAASGLPREMRTAAGLDTIAHHCAERLDARLARPPRATDDWSINLPGGCNCQLCDTLGRFLADPIQRTFEWPLAKEGRRHVHSTIERSALPVSHQTRRTGRPYTLVLTKTPALFEREKQERRRDEEDRAWLEGF
jgi:predicted 2-oxoglutarate/Fe(II)-dependent dioxygenase YbiX